MTAGPAWLAGPLVLAGVAYLVAAAAVPGWPRWRAVAWLAGLLTAAAAGPVATAGHTDFRVHVAGHLMLGMAAPLLLVLAAPVTLALRALPVRAARRLSRVLRWTPVRVISHPVTAAVLDVGGLWLLYRSGLYPLLSHDPVAATLVHTHMLVAGYLFTAAILGVDPAPHRPGRPARAVVLVAYLAAHQILAKTLYAQPPPGVPAESAQAGAQLMYYGGNLVELALIVVFCAHWYAEPSRIRDSRHRRPEIARQSPDSA